MLKVEIYITLKDTLADPQGLTVKHALDSLGYKELDNVRIGKLITATLNIENKKEAEQRLNEVCKKLLANPIIENYSFRIKEV